MDVQQILSAAKAHFKPVEVQGKVIPPTIDTANLAIIDINPLEKNGSSLLAVTRDNVQLLVNRIFDLARKTDDSGVYAVLPPEKSSLIPIPREKPLPKPKAKTTWEKFAEKRGIKGEKKAKTSFDEASGKYLPTHGRNSAKNNPMNDWIREIPDNEEAEGAESSLKKKSSFKKKK